MIRATTSHFISSEALFIVRFFFALFAWCFIIMDVWVLGFSELRFMTDLSWFGITVYLTTVVVHSFWTRINKTISKPWVLEVIQFFFITSQVLAPIVTVVFWSMLSDVLDEPVSDVYKFVQATPHAANIIIVQTELWLCCLSFTLAQIWIFLLVASAYTLLTYTLYYGANIEFPYPFFNDYLDFTKNSGIACAGILIVLLIFSLVYILVWAEIKLRDWIASRRSYIQ